MDYIKVLRKMCEISKKFNTFMHKPTERNYGIFQEDELDEFDDFNIIYNGSELTVHCARGATKACFHIEDEPYVVKVGFSNYRVNHAEREANLFSEASSYGVSQFLVPCQKIGEIFNTPIFSMEFVEVSEEKVTSDMWERCSSVMSNDEIRDIIDFDYGYVEALFPFYYSEDELNLLFDFIRKMEINDLHSGNIGYDGNGKIKIIDYSGFFII